MTSTARRLLVAVVVAAVLGFAVGWYARVWSEPTVESRMHDAAEKLNQKAREILR